MAATKHVYVVLHCLLERWFARMRIVYITHYFPPMGRAAATNTYRIVKGLSDRGHELTVFCPETRAHAPRSAMQNISQAYPFKVCYSFPTPRTISVVVPHLFNALRALKHQYDLLITQFHLFHLASFTGVPLRIFKGKPWIVKVHDMIPYPALPSVISKKGFINSCYGMSLRMCYGIFLKDIGKRSDKVLVLTRELQSLLLENEFSPDKIAAIPHGVDTKIFSPPISNGNSTNKKTILYIGSMAPEDGLTSLVKAFALLNQEKELNLTLIGDGPERLQLMELVKKLNLEQKVTFYRHIPHELIAEFIKSAYITVGPLCLSPINYYTIPTKILEYFACGKPVVSSPVSKDILTDEFTGFVVNKVTPENISEKLSVLIEDEKLATEIGKKARRLVVEKFDWERVIDNIEKEIGDLEPHRFS